MKKIKKSATAWLLCFLAVLMSISSLVMMAPTSKAADLQNFHAGRIIDDAIFTNDTSMTAAQIQSFLNTKGANCTNGQQACLKNYSEGGRVAAQIIYDTAREFQINSQVLIVLLQKEVGLVTANQPATWQYRTATGYGCPDTAACDSQYYGFTNQLRWAGRMYRSIMNNSSTWYTPYSVGNNQVYYHPNLSGCGSSTVRIENRATVALYSYTPYQPNQASLNAGYGLGDSCSSYGNRNFFSYFSDWFGSPLLNSSFLRTEASGTVYLVSGNYKYPVSDVRVLNAAFPLGGVGFTSQAYLNTKTTGPTLGRIIRATDGSVYYFDAGIKLGFNSCAQVEDYGYTCAQAVNLSDAQIAAFVTGPRMTSIYKTTSGKKFHIVAGEKREVYDNASLTQAGLPNNFNILSEAALDNLTYGMPVVRNDVFIINRANNALYAQQSGQATKISNDVVTLGKLSKLAINAFDAGSIAKIATSDTISSFMKNGTSNYVFTGEGKRIVSNPTEWSSSFKTVSPGLLGQLKNASAVTSPYFIKSSNRATIYRFGEGQKRAISSMSDLMLLSNNSPVVMTLTESSINQLSTGSVILSPGSLVKAPNNGTVYMIDGLTHKIALSSFNPAYELGLSTNVGVVGESILSQYQTNAVSNLTNTVTCNSKKYIGLTKKIAEQTIASASYVTLDPLTCKKMKTVAMPSFLRSSDGTIYKIEAATRRPITSYNKYIELGGNASNTLGVSNYAMSAFPVGSNL